MNPSLVLTGISKRYGTMTAVDQLSLTAMPGQLLGFLGPNGAGKTTTIRMIMSILYPDEGEINILGASRAIDIKDRIGYLPEERGLYRKMTVERTLHFLGSLKGLHGARLKERIDAGLALVGLQDWRKRNVEALSKGMQQKLQFVATVLHEPELVILDEPFSGLDPLNRDLLEKLMIDLRNRGKTVIFSTHQMEQAERLCDRIVLINRGRKLIEGTMAEVRRQFSTRVLNIMGHGDLSSLAELPGIAFANITAGNARLELAEQTDPQDILKAAIARARIDHFAIESPDLQQIFIKLVEQDGGGMRSVSGTQGVTSPAREVLR